MKGLSRSELVMEWNVLSLPARQSGQEGFSFVLYTGLPQGTEPALICILGPTGAGKSELAIRMAENLDGEIVNCDSLQIYRGFNIGTAKVPLAERRGIAHHLLDFIEPTATFTAGDYARAAREVIHGIASRGKTPIVAGGTGFYLRALLDGLPSLPGRDDILRSRLAGRDLHRLLLRVDPKAAGRIHANDMPKLIRALEVRILTGRPATGQPPAEPLRGFSIRKIGLFPPREELYRKIDQRCATMFANGLIEEVQGLLDSGVPASARAFESLGYRQALACLRGELPLPAAIAAAQQATRNYAKRQITWFRHEPGIVPYSE